MGCSESSSETGGHIWQSEFVEGLESAFSEHSLLIDSSTLISSFASEPMVKTQNEPRSVGIISRDGSGLEVDAHASTFSPGSIVVLPFRRGRSGV